MDYGPDGGNSVRIETCGIGCASCIKNLLSQRGPTAVTSTTRIEIAAYGHPIESFTYPAPKEAIATHEAPESIEEEKAHEISSAAAA